MKNRIAVRSIIGTENYAIYDILMPNIIIAQKEEIDAAILHIQQNTISTTAIKNAFLSSHGKINTIYVILTNACNLACDYCFTHENISTGNMNLQTANHLVNRIKEYMNGFSENLTITFYGGEPIINIDIALFIMDELLQYPNIKFQLVTNGTLLDINTIYKLVKYPLLIGVSLDGYESLHNSHRKYINGNDTYSDVTKAISMLVANNCDVSLSITLTNEIINNQNIFFTWLNDLKINKITFNLLRCVFNSEQAAHDYYSKAATFLYEFYKYHKEKNIFEYNIFNRLKCLYDNTILYAECAASSGNQITIDTAGNLFTCQIYRKNTAKIGTIIDTSFNAISLPLTKETKPIFSDYCDGCYALPVCGGGCPVQAKQLCKKKTDSPSIDPSICYFSKKIMDYALQDIIELTH